MRLRELLTEYIDHAQLDQVEKFADALWHRLGIDIKFTRHFMDRLNDPRNGRPITVTELTRLFTQQYHEYGGVIADLPVGSQAVLRLMVSNLNLPFVIKSHGRDHELVAMTIMRKQNFGTPDPVYTVREHAVNRYQCEHARLKIL